MQIKLRRQYDKAMNQIASDLGYYWGEHPNVRGMIQAIATSELKIVKADEIQSEQYSRLKELIEAKQPFKLAYADSAGEPFVFSCLYAEISSEESKPYLNIWFTEEMESDCPELKHNRCLRIDRITNDFKLHPLDLPWREEGLDTIEIIFELFGNLVFAYSKKEGDIIEELGEKHLRITRKIDNLFWFKRRIIKYAPHVKITAPVFVEEWYTQLLSDSLEKQQN